MADEQGKFDPFKPAQPRIPGVSDAPPAPATEPVPAPVPAKPAPRGKLPPQGLMIGGAGAIVLGALLAWIFLRPSPPMASEPQTAAAIAAGGVEPAAATPASTSSTVTAEVPPHLSR